MATGVKGGTLSSDRLILKTNLKKFLNEFTVERISMKFCNSGHKIPGLMKIIKIGNAQNA